MKRIQKSSTQTRTNEKPSGLSKLRWRMFVDEATAKMRMNTCWACQELNSARFCRVCWCFMPVKSKLAVFGCPKKFWPAESNYTED